MKLTFRRCKILTLLFAGAAFLATQVCAQGGVAPPPMSALEKEADTPFRAGDWAKAAPAYEAVVKAEPINGRAHFRLGMAYLSLNQNQQAAEALRGAVSLKFALAAGNYNLACALTRLGRKEDALGALEAAVKAGFGNLQQIQSDNDLTALRGEARFAALVAQMQRAARPCEFDDHYKEFDFWVGEWDVTPAGAPRPVAQSRIEKILASCVVLENWMPQGNTGGKSFNIYNSTTKKWEQFWVDGVGSAIHFFGEARDGNMYYTSETPGPNGQTTLGKMTYIKLGPDKVRQIWETSTDNGKTWAVTFDGIYDRKK